MGFMDDRTNLSESSMVEIIAPVYITLNTCTCRYHLLRIAAYVPAQTFEIDGIICCWCETSYVVFACRSRMCSRKPKEPMEPINPYHHRQLRHFS